MLKKAIIRTRRAGLSHRGMAPKRENSLVVPASTHSNDTIWPAYANIAPLSWLLQHDVDEGRQKVNFSEWQRPQDESQEAAESVADGEMPPRMYTLPHPEARLSSAERSLLIRGLQATLGTETRGLNGH